MSRPITVLGVEETVQLINQGPTRLREITFFNNAAAATYLQLFNAKEAGDVTIGTTLAVFAPGAAIARELVMTGLELHFDLGLVIGMTTTPDGNTGPSADILSLSLGIDP